MSASVDLVVFLVGANVYAADAESVRAIQATSGRLEGAVVDTELGQPMEGMRALAVRRGKQERSLVVDRVVGVRSVPAADVHPIPALAAACLKGRSLVGFAMLDQELTPIVDLGILLGRKRGPRTGRTTDAR